MAVEICRPLCHIMSRDMDLAIWLSHLVGGLEHFLFSHILEMSSSQVTFIFFRGVAQPPTSIYMFFMTCCIAWKRCFCCFFELTIFELLALKLDSICIEGCQLTFALVVQLIF